jgi:hypothetical protein
VPVSKRSVLAPPDVAATVSAIAFASVCMRLAYCAKRLGWSAP